ncbi:MAG: hypothetical protein M3N98_01380, partial [Actinomycetota bacterium]|nr:hypothetical protein [Actinomycetota bacterium]
RGARRPAATFGGPRRTGLRSRAAKGNAAGARPAAMKRRTTALRVLVAAATIAAAELVAATPASAHTVGGVAPSDYQSSIVGLTPPTAGISVRLLDLGRRIQLTNTAASDVIVVGYQREDYLRIGPGGVYQNIHSPAVYQNRPLPPGVTAATLPFVAQPQAAPEWQKISSGHTATWSDRRTRWEGPRPPAVVRNPGRVTAVAGWSIPLRQGPITIHLQGRIVWVPRPNPLPWAGLAVALFFLAVVVGRTRWWGQGLAILLALLVAVDVARSYAASLISAGPITVELFRTLTAGVVGSILWALGGWAIALLQTGRERGLLIGAFTGFGIALFSGLTDLPYLLHSQVPVAAPTALARAGVAIATGIGFGVATACVLRFRSLPVDQRDELRGKTSTSPSDPETTGHDERNGEALGLNRMCAGMVLSAAAFLRHPAGWLPMER